MLSNFSGSLASKCVSLINKICMIRPSLTDLSPAELNYYPFMISLDKYSGSGDAADDLPTKTKQKYNKSKTKYKNYLIIQLKYLI